MSSSKKIDLLKDLRQVFICLRPRPNTPHPYTLYTCNSILIHIGKGMERVEPERRLEVQQFKKLGRKYQDDWLYL